MVENPNLAQVAAVLDTQRSRLPIQGDYVLAPLTQNAFQLDHAGGRLLVKWAAHDNSYGLREIQANRTLRLAEDLLVPQMLAVLDAEGGQVGCWEWVDGEDLRDTQRHLLPEAFAALGRFHDRRRTDGPVQSPTTYASFATVREMLDAEWENLSAPLDPPFKDRCRPLFAVLHQGFATLIHGDLHPANVLRTEAGLVFSDWGYAIPSLNLFDLEYVYSVDFGINWWAYSVPPEANALLDAYFSSCGPIAEDHRRLHLAEMLWSALRMYDNNSKAGPAESIANSRRIIEMLLAEDGDRI